MAPMDQPPTSASHSHPLAPPQLPFPPPPPPPPQQQQHTPTSLHSLGPHPSPTYGNNEAPRFPSAIPHPPGSGYLLPPPPGPPPPHPDTSYQHKIAPLPAHHSVDHSYGSSYVPPSTAYNSLPPRKKPNRAAQACNVCRLKKQKCDEKHPCGSCAKDGLDCQYRGSQQSKPDRVLDAVQRMLEQSLEDFQYKIDHMSAKLEGIESHLGVASTEPRPRRQQRPVPIRTGIGMAIEGSGNDYEDEDEDEEDEDPDEAGYNFREGSPRKALRRGQMSVPRAEDLNPVVKKASHEQVSLGETDESADFSISQSALIREHTTGAHHLSKWQYVADLFEGIPDDYAMKAEKDQGILRPNGIGPAIPDDLPSYANDPRSPYGDDVKLGLDFPEGVCGIDLPAQSSIPDLLSGDHIGGLNAQGELNLDENVVHALKDSYLKHMHALHPFIHREHLERLIRTFVQIHSPNLSTSQQEMVGMKRKRSNTDGESPNGLQPPNSIIGGGSNPSTPSVMRIPCRRPEHSISNAVVLLVMALGKMLDHGDPIPPIPHHTRDDVDKGSSPISLVSHDGTINQTRHSGFQSLSADSKARPISPGQDVLSSNPRFSRPMPPPPPPPPLSLQQTGPATSGPSIRRHRTFSTTSGHGVVRNMDVIPGMAYYAYATTILGGIAGGHSLSHVHAYLLAGLMMGQLSRVTESWHWINLACRTCLLLIKEDVDALRAPLDPEWAEPRPGSRPGWSAQDIEAIKFAFWTCLQLEGDILAEFETLPHSGVSSFEDKIGYPSAMGDPDKHLHDGPTVIQEPQQNGMLMFHYSSQIYLRKTLNKVHSRVYGKENQQTDSEAVLMGPTIFQWRQNLPEWLQWDDDDYMTDDIHMARLRGKYYGGGYIITRPFLRRAITKLTPADIRQIRPDLLRDPPRRLLQLPEFSPDRITRINQIIEVSKWCLWLAIRSTTAFDGLRGRWRVTNIHGTLTAQFSNMLVLFAAYNSFLQPTLDKALLIRLFNRTIALLDRYAGLSLSLRINARILRRARDIVEGKRRLPMTRISGVGPMSISPSPSAGPSLSSNGFQQRQPMQQQQQQHQQQQQYHSSQGHATIHPGPSSRAQSNSYVSTHAAVTSLGPSPMSMSRMVTPAPSVMSIAATISASTPATTAATVTTSPMCVSPVDVKPLLPPAP